jgi:hypothetical protein
MNCEVVMEYDVKQAIARPQNNYEVVTEIRVREQTRGRNLNTSQ